MAMGFDELVEQLLYDVALSGSRGIGVDELAKATKAFYESRQQKNQPEPVNEEDLLFSDAPPAGSTVVDDKFLDAVWEWLEKHPDVEIRTVNEDEAEPKTTENESIDQPSPSKHAGQRIFTNEDRVWQVIAGHGVDYSRVPRRMFDCLSVIAAHGPEGVLQPTVTQLTKQDKRSVPKRTDKLAEMGYITKEQVHAQGMRTTLLKLARFAETQAQGQTQSKSEDAPAYAVAVKNPKKLRKVAYYDVWFDQMIRMLKENDNVIAFTDLCVGLDIQTSTWYIKALQVRTRRLAETGCIRKIRALVEGEGGGDRAADQYIRSIQLLREPTKADRKVFVKNKTYSADSAELQGGDGHDHEVREEDAIDSEDGDSDAESMDEEQSRIPPQWTPDQLYTNLVFNIIDTAGPEGISSMELNRRAMGPLFRRPLDEIMQRLTDVWQKSQPPHLRHLTIVRDTDMDGKQSHFIYRTMRNFEEAVEMGLTTWEAVTGNSKAGIKSKGKKNATPEPELDQWGFPKPDARLFASKDGWASLLECQTAAKKEVRLAGDGEVANEDADGTPETGSKVRKKPGPKPRAKAIEALEFEVDGAGPATPTPTSSTRTRPGPKPKQINLDSPATASASNSAKRVRKSTQDDEIEYERNARLLAEILARAEMNREAKKRAADETESLSQSHKRKRRRTLRHDSPSPVNTNNLTGTELDSARIDEIHADLLSRSKPGVYLNPPGARDMKFDTLMRPGNQKRALIAVFKSESMRDFSWFTPENSTPAQRVTRKKHDLDEGEAQAGEVGASEERSSKRRKSGVNEFAEEHGVSIGNDSLATPTVKKKRGRPTKAMLEERERLRELALAEPSSLMEPAHLEASNGHLLSRDDNGVLETLSSSSPAEDTPATPKRVVNNSPPLGPNTPRTPEMTTAAGKKRGRPPKLDGNGQKRRRRTLEPDEGTPPAESLHVREDSSLLVRLSVSPQALRTFRAKKPTFARPSRIIRFPVPSAQLGRLHPSVSKDQADDHPQSSGDEDRGPEDEYSNTSSAQQALVVKLPLTPAAKSGATQPSMSDARTAKFGLKIIRPYHTASSFAAKEALRREEVSDYDAHRDADTPTIDKAVFEGPSNDAMPTKTGDSTITAPFEEADRTLNVPTVSEDRVVVNPEPGKYKADEVDDPAELSLVELGDDFNYKDKMNKKAGTPRQGGMVHFRREKIVLDIMRKAGGVYPGDHEIWYPFITAWPQSYRTQPDRHTVENVVNLLIKEGKLKKFSFSFKEKDSDKTVQRHILTESGFDESSPKVKKVQQAIIESWPYRFLPNQVPIRADLRKRARDIAPISAKGIPYKRDESERDEAVKDTEYRPPKTSFSSTHQWEGEDQYPSTPTVVVKRTAKGLAAASSDPRRTSAATPKKVAKAVAISDDEDESESSDDSDGEVSKEQALLQDQFQLDAYQHTPETAIVKRQGNRPRPTLGRGVETASVPHGLTVAGLQKQKPGPRPNFGREIATASAPYGLTVAGLPKRKPGPRPKTPAQNSFMRPVQTFTKTTGTFGTFEQRERSQSAPKLNSSSNAGHRIQEHGHRPPHTYVNGAAMEQPQRKSSRNPKPTEKMRSLLQPMTPMTMPRSFTLPELAPGVPAYEYGPYSPFLFDLDRPQLPLSLLQSPTPPSTAFQPPAQPIVSTTTVKEKRPYVYKPRQQAKPLVHTEHVDAVPGPVDWESDDDYQPRQSRSSGRVGGSTKPSGSPNFKRLAITLALVRMLTKGAKPNQGENWNLIAHALGQKDTAIDVQQQWRARFKGGYDSAYSKRLQDELYEPFLKAYENDELPAIDFDKLEDVDWPGLIRWVETKIPPEDADWGTQDLTEIRRALDSGSEILLQLPAEETNTDLSSVTPTVRLPADGANENQRKDLDKKLILEKSWIRAVAATKDANYDAGSAYQKLAAVGESTVLTATQEMVGTGTLVPPRKGRQGPGRNYQISDFALSQFDRWPSAGFLKSVSSARNGLTAHFREYDILELDPNVDEAHAMVLANMVAQGHLRITSILPERNDDINAPWPKLSKWGYLQTGKDVDQSQFLLQVMYKKTPAFTSKCMLKPGVPLPTYPAAVPGERSLRIPFWIDIHGNFIDDAWDMVLSSVLHLLVYKPGCTTKTIESAHKTKIWAWEIEMVLAWMEKVGLALRCGPGTEEGGVWRGGWKASEWWYCTFLPEVATWKVPQGVAS